MGKGARRSHIVSKGKKPPESGITKGKTPSKTALQKFLDKWPPKGGGEKKH